MPPPSSPQQRQCHTSFRRCPHAPHAAFHHTNQFKNKCVTVQIEPLLDVTDLCVTPFSLHLLFTHSSSSSLLHLPHQVCCQQVLVLEVSPLRRFGTRLSLCVFGWLLVKESLKKESINESVTFDCM